MKQLFSFVCSFFRGILRICFPKVIILTLILFTFTAPATFSQITWTETQPYGSTISSNPNGTKVIAGRDRLYISTNGGSNWTETQPAGDINSNWSSSSMSSDGLRMIAGNTNLYITSDGGNSWTEVQVDVNVDRHWTTSMSSDGMTIFAGQNRGRVFKSSDGGATWAETRPAGNTNRQWTTSSISSDGMKVIMGASGSGNGRLYLSTDAGITWSETHPAGNVVQDWNAVSMNSDGSIIIAGVQVGGRLYITSDGGDTWLETQPIGDVNGNWRCVSISSNGLRIFVGSAASLYISTDGGATWSETQPAGNVNINWQISAISSDGLKLFAGVLSNGRMFLGSFNNPPTVTTNPAADITSSTVTLNGSVNPNGDATDAYFEWGTDNTLTTFNTTSSQSIGSGTSAVDISENLTGLAPNTTYYFRAVGTNSTGNESGSILSFTTLDLTTPELFQSIIDKINAFVVAGVINNGNGNALKAKINAAINSYNKNKFHTAINQLNAFKNQVNAFMQAGKFTAIQGASLIDPANTIISRLSGDNFEIIAEAPDEYELSQNFPNPFNPVTNITYGLPLDGIVTLKVYDLSGKEVATLVNEFKTMGYHIAAFDASSLSSGIYFYTINAISNENTFVMTKKLMLIK